MSQEAAIKRLDNACKEIEKLKLANKCLEKENKELRKILQLFYFVIKGKTST